jgi:hypothetical protein
LNSGFRRLGTRCKVIWHLGAVRQLGTRTPALKASQEPNLCAASHTLPNQLETPCNILQGVQSHSGFFRHAPAEGRLLTLLSSFSKHSGRHLREIVADYICIVFIMLAVLALELIGWFIYLGLLITIGVLVSSGLPAAHHFVPPARLCRAKNYLSGHHVPTQRPPRISKSLYSRFIPPHLIEFHVIESVVRLFQVIGRAQDFAILPIFCDPM